MNKTKSFIIVTLVVGILLLLIYFSILPQITENFSEVSKVQTEKIKGQILLIMISYFILAFVINLGVLKIENKIEKEKREIQSFLKINPRDQYLQEKLKEIEERKERYFTLIEFILTIIFGLIIGFVTITIIRPIYDIIVSLK